MIGPVAAAAEGFFGPCDVNVQLCNGCVCLRIVVLGKTVQQCKMLGEAIKQVVECAACGSKLPCAERLPNDIVVVNAKGQKVPFPSTFYFMVEVAAIQCSEYDGAVNNAFYAHR